MQEDKEEEEMGFIDHVIQDVFESGGPVHEQIATIQKLMAEKTKEGPGNDKVVWKAELSQLENAFKTLLRLRDVQVQPKSTFKIHEFTYHQ